MKYFFTLALSLHYLFSLAQDNIEWDRVYRIKIEDFKSTATQIGDGNKYGIASGCMIDFSFAMSNYEFMATKNFNSKAKAIFNRNASYLIAPDQETADQLIKFSQFEFDLTELYTRKFRKKMFENKGAFSNSRFFQPLYQEVQNEYNTRHAETAKLADLGKNEEKLKELHEQVLKEIEELPEFCKACKPKKKKS